ncbi:pyridoxamine 5'-phosphate oxidase family protein [Streptomyces triticagri]|uniref:Pyridoxamine 5'-phosphate oxidase family protein n=1 Tax=Streptomyces triticagri TaxID=2293568 RepID=A0A372LZR3_9ACTN|nr:pyridoxamine 5'-phosphate oxidase family protein [Streptomyces triticagri]RFU84166.1 pyridoxamine 5'-phosphate oxidase family protein [Streptomyces triticagri]
MTEKAAGDKPAPRSLAERLRDTRKRLEEDVDAWVASAGAEAAGPYLVPLSFHWDGTELLFATPTTSPTARNLLASGRARVAIGPTRDVVMVDGSVRAVSEDELDEATGDEFAARTSFEPRRLRQSHHYFWVRPERIQAWREANELAGRELMRDGEWLSPDGSA